MRWGGGPYDRNHSFHDCESWGLYLSSMEDGDLMFACLVGACMPKYVDIPY